jgi:hypothetical protein
MRSNGALEDRDKGCEDDCARGVAGEADGGQGIIALPNTTHILGIPQILERIYITLDIV